MRVSDNGLELLKEFEGFRAAVYSDIVGIATVGYGHVVREGEVFDHPLTDPEATTLLKRDLALAESCVLRSCSVPLTQNQYDALCSLIFNIGCMAFKNSTLLRKLNDEDYLGAAEQFELWNKAGGHAVAGLTRRRRKERARFESPNGG